MKDRTNQPKPPAARRTTRPGFCSFKFIAWLLVLACFVSPLAAAPLRIYIVTDLEGARDVYKFAQTREPGHPLGEKAKEYLVFDNSSKSGRRVTKEGTIEDASKPTDF